MRAGSTCGALVVWLALATPTSLGAQTAPVEASDTSAIAPLDSLETRDATRDLEIDLELVLADATTRARRWHRAWAITFALGLAAQGVLIGVASSRDERIANLLGLIPPITGLTIQLATPLAALGGPEPNEPPEITLQRYARSEREKRNWFAHVGPIFLNLAVAALQLFVADRPVTAGLQVGIGVTLSQTQLWTSPRVATRASP
ncbi:MAG: hypothetical protein MUE69_10230 [Myxococcota bacterium]|jgi:hypothetical protein|nr:hypothetical protein [Myxococcota bacterium]